MAGEAWLTIYEAHSGQIFSTDMEVPWKEGVDPSKFSLERLTENYNSAAPVLRPGLLEYIWKREDIPKVDRMDFMMRVLKNDSSLRAMEYAGRFFVQGAGINIKPMALEYLKDWWDKHRQEVVGK